jgi:nicotinic acid mononucleotide adenylyltransferase
MDEYTYTLGTITGIEEENGTATRYRAVIGNKVLSGIHPDHRFWKDVQEAIAAGEPVKPFVAPPVVDPKIAALEASDAALLKAAARPIEDMLVREMARGEFVPQKVKDIIDERAMLRKS